MEDHASVRAIILTADDAILAKQATVDAGYYADPFLSALASSAVGLSGPLQKPLTRKKYHQPLIKRGTHARVSCMDRGIRAFLNMSHDKTPQVVVLGAGLDTTFYRYLTGLLSVTSPHGVRWYEIDHPEVIHSKAATILQLTQTTMKSSTILPTGSGFLVRNEGTNSTCFMVAHDLRQPGMLEQLHFFDKTAHTLFVLECVQMYLPSDCSRSILNSISQQCSKVCVLLYDPILGSSPFGKVMEDHLNRARVTTSLSTMVKTRTVMQHLEFLLACGYGQAVGCDMWSAYQTVVTSEQRQQANQCECLDEMEEWILIMRHYCLIVACNNVVLEEYCKVGQASPLGFVEGMSDKMKTEVS
jgi:O-methyltransferase involved in polyketide biosynthesis